MSEAHSPILDVGKCLYRRVVNVLVMMSEENGNDETPWKGIRVVFRSIVVVYSHFLWQTSIYLRIRFKLKLPMDSRHCLSSRVVNLQCAFQYNESTLPSHLPFDLTSDLYEIQSARFQFR